MKKQSPITLLDVTLREGSYLVDYQVKTKDVTHIVDYLDAAHVQYIEIGHGGGVGASKLGYPSAATDLEYIEAARSVAKKAKLGMLVNPNWNCLPDFDEIAPLVDFVRIGANVNNVFSAAPYVERAKKQGLFVFFQLLRSPALPAFRVAAAARKVEKMGVDVIYIVDTMGSMTPKEVREYVKVIKAQVKTPLGFHAHNNLGLAIANSLEAARCGCKFIDASLLGVGRQAGNTQLETIALLLEREGFKTSLDIPLLLDTAESLVAPVFTRYKGAEPYDLWSAYWNLDLYPRWAYQQLAIVLGLDTKSLIKEMSRLKNFVTLDEEQLLALSKRFKVPYDKLAAAAQSPCDTVKKAN